MQQGDADARCVAARWQQAGRRRRRRRSGGGVAQLAGGGWRRLKAARTGRAARLLARRLARRKDDVNVRTAEIRETCGQLNSGLYSALVMK